MRKRFTLIVFLLSLVLGLSAQVSINHNATVVITATPKANAVFVKWSDGVTTNPRTITMDKDYSLTAIFEKKSYTLTTSASPTVGGTVTAGGTVQSGATKSLTATPKTGYVFSNWTVSGTGAKLSSTTSATTTFTMGTANATVTANFVLVPSFEHYTISSTPNDVSMGTVTMEVPNQEMKILPGAFSVSATKKVRFSPGNLQYQASTNTWRFAEHQYDYIGATNASISSTYGGWIDLFGWGTSGWNSGAKAYQPYSTSTTNSDYRPGNSDTTNLTGTYANADWGVYNAITNGGNAKGMWRTLTNDEWNYLFNSRTNYNKLWSFATVNGISGVVLLPDSWSLPSGLTFTAASEDFGTNVYTVAQWTKMENAGAVFLPAAGYRNGTSMRNVGTFGIYWSSTYFSSFSKVYYVYFYSGLLFPSNYGSRYYGHSVRLCAEF